MNSWHLVDEYVLSPLHSEAEVTPQDSVSQIGSVKSKSSSTSSKRSLQEAKRKAAVATLQAKQLAQQAKRDNEVREQELLEVIAQKELELKLELRKRELELLRKKRENEEAVISAQNQAEIAQLEHEILGQESIDGKRNKVQSSEIKESTGTGIKDNISSSRADVSPVVTLGYVSQNPERAQVCADVSPVVTLGYVSQKPENIQVSADVSPVMTLGYVSQKPESTQVNANVNPAVTLGYVSQQHEYITPVNATSKSFPAKVLQFPAPYSDGRMSGIVQAQTAKVNVSERSTYDTQQNLFSTSVSWSTTPGPRCPEILNRETPQAAEITSANPTPTIYYNYQAASNRPHLSTTPTWGPGTQSTSTPFQISPTPSRRTMQTPSSGEPVDTFINRLKDGHETVFETSFNDSRLDSSMALLRAQEQQRLPPLELFVFTGKPIEWPTFIERFRDQIHNKTTLTDSDRMAYLYQNLGGEAKKAVESLGVTGHSYPMALKTLKRLFRNPSSVASAYLTSMLDSPYVTPNDRQGLRDYYYRVKACTTWCVKMGQSAILQTPEYLSRATMRLPMNLRVKWYEHIDSRSDRATLTEFEKWLCKRVDTLFNPLEDFICEERNKMQRSTARPKSSVRLHPLATTTDRLPDVPQNCSDKPVQVQSHKRESRNNVQSNEHKCFVCLHNNHRVAFCPVFKSKPVKERGKIAWDRELCFNCLKANHQSRDCLSTNRCLRCGQTHHTLLHEDRQSDPSTDSASSTLKGRTQSSAPPNADSRYLEPSTTPVPVATCTSGPGCSRQG